MSSLRKRAKAVKAHQERYKAKIDSVTSKGGSSLRARASKVKAHQQRFKTRTDELRKGVSKKFHTSTGKSTGHKGYRTGTGKTTGHSGYGTGTGNVMDGYFTAEVGGNNRRYIDSMSEGY